MSGKLFPSHAQPQSSSHPLLSAPGRSTRTGELTPPASVRSEARAVLGMLELNTPAAIKGKGAVSHSESGMPLCYIVTGKYFMDQK